MLHIKFFIFQSVFSDVCSYSLALVFFFWSVAFQEEIMKLDYTTKYLFKNKIFFTWFIPNKPSMLIRNQFRQNISNSSHLGKLQTYSKSWESFTSTAYQFRLEIKLPMGEKWVSNTAIIINFHRLCVTFVWLSMSVCICVTLCDTHGQVEFVSVVN